MMDVHRRITTWSTGAERVFGYVENEVIGRLADLIFTDEDCAAHVPEQEIETAARTGEAADDRYHVRKSGTRFWANGVLTALYDGDGNLRGYAKVLRDNTERKEASERLEQMNETLEQRVRERTAQVRALASKLTMAEQEERRRVSQILHDNLQQHLYGLQMKLTMIERDAASGDRQILRRRADAASHSIRDAIRTTRQLAVDLSPPVLKDEGLSAAVRWLVTLMADVHRLEVELQADDELRIANEDMRVLLFQTVRELLFNVVRHSGTDRARVTLRRDGDCAWINVADRGEGFDAALAERQQASVGLYTLRERLELFGGNVTIDSAPGKGTSVTVTVPIDKSFDQTENA
jgi:two-component system, chemotaxis family, CheB/CheR fusion protein